MRAPIIAPFFIICIGVGWLLTARQVVPGVNWLWICLLAASGISLLIARRPTRSTLIAGPFLILCALSSYLRQAGFMPTDIEVPMLVIAFGILLLVARLLPLSEDPHQQGTKG